MLSSSETTTARRTPMVTPMCGECGECGEEGSPQRWLTAAERWGVDRVLVVCAARSPDGPPTAAGSTVGVVVASADPMDQQHAPFELVVLCSSLVVAAPEVRRAAVHQAMVHLRPLGRLVVAAEAWPAVADLCVELGLVATPEPCESRLVVAHRGPRPTVHDLLWEARATITRVDAPTLARELHRHEPPLVVDTRTHTDRCRAGVIAGSIHVPRTVLEWHLDPSNGYRHPQITGFDQQLVVVCNGGYSSSLAASNLHRIGFTAVRDLVGGMRSWTRHGFGVVEPDHAHLDL